MSKIIVIALLAGNLILLGVRAANPQAAPQTDTAPPLASGVPPVVLLSELPADFRPSGLQCFSLGPFATETSAARVLDRNGGDPGARNAR